MLQPARTDPVRTILVFLHLLERQTESVSKLPLAHPGHHPAHAHPTAYMFVRGVWRLFGHDHDGVLTAVVTA
jgi:hypothetical protein